MKNCIRVLSLDIGFKKTGIAVGQSLTKTAQAIAVLKKNINELKISDFANFFQEYQIDVLLIGYPQHSDGSEHPLHKHLERLWQQFQQSEALLAWKNKPQVFFIDEYLSSHTARERLPKNKQHLRDAEAAAVIAEVYLSEL